MSVRGIFKPPVVLVERVSRSAAVEFQDELQSANRMAMEAPRLARVSAERNGEEPGVAAAGDLAMHRSWSFAPRHHAVSAQVETQNGSAQVDEDATVQDGWERAILDAQQRRTQQQDGWEHTITDGQVEEAEAATEAADAELDDAVDAFEAAIEEFTQEWASEHGASVSADGTLLLPADEFETLAAEWEEDFQSWWNVHVEELNAAYAGYGEAVALELRQAALAAEALGEDPNQAVSEQADEIRQRDSNGDWSADGSWLADEQDQTTVDTIGAAEAQVLGESQEVREAQVDYIKESQELASALDTLEDAQNLPDNLADKPEEIAAAETTVSEEAAEAEAAAAVLEAAVADQMEDLGQEVLVELAEQLGVTAPVADVPGLQPPPITDLSDTQLLALIQDALAKFEDPQEAAGVIDTLDEDTRSALAAVLGVEPDELGTVLGDPVQLSEALGAEDAQSAIDTLADQLIGMAAGAVSDAHGNNSYIDSLLFGGDDSPGVIDQVAVDLRVGELGSIVEAIDPGELSGVEKQLWEAGDQVSVALLRQLGISFVETQDVRPEGSGLNYGAEGIDAVIDGERIRLSGAEEELLAADPVALALFLAAGFRFEGSSGSGAIGLSLEGVSYATVEDQIGLLDRTELEQLADQLGIVAPNADHYRPGELPQTLADLSDGGLRSLVLDHLEDTQALPDSLGPTLGDLTQELVDQGRLSAQDQQGFAEWLEESLGQARGNPGALAAIAGTLWWYGNDVEGLAAEVAVAGALRLQQAGEEVSVLMAQGKDAQAQQLLTTNMDAALSEEERAILWQQIGLQHFGQDYWSAEIDDLIADHEGQRSIDDWLWDIKDDISPEMAHLILGQISDKVDLDSVDLDDGAFFSSLSAIVTLADQRLDPTRSTSWAQSMSEWLLQPTESHPYGYRFSLGNLTNAILEGSGSGLAEAYAAQTREGWQSAIEEAKQHPEAIAKYVAQEFAYFENHKHNIVPDYFDRIMDQPGIGEAQEVVYGDDLRDLIANGMDLDWRANEVDRDTVDHIMGEMFEEAGIGEEARETTAITVTVIPYIYAAERDGWATGALFDVDGPDTKSESVVQGGGYATTVTETDANDFVIDGGVIANLASQAASQGTTIDALTKEQPWKFDSVKHFQDKNYLSENGLLYLPYELGQRYGLGMDRFGPSADHAVQVGTTAAAIETTGEKIWKGVDVAVTIASIATMFIPIGGIFLSSGLRAMSLAATRAILWASTLYTAGRGAGELNQMRNLGIDTGWANQMARSIYLEILGTAAGSWSMAANPLTKSLLNASGPGFASVAARTAYASTQAGNAIDLATGAWLTHQTQNQLAASGENATAWDKLMAAIGPAMLTMGAIGMHHDAKLLKNHLNQDAQDYIRSSIDAAAQDLWRKDNAPRDNLHTYQNAAVNKLFAPLVDQRIQNHWVQAGKTAGEPGTHREQALQEVHQIAARYLAENGADPVSAADDLYNASLLWVENSRRNKVPNVNIRKIALGTLLLRGMADAIGLLSGGWGRYNAVGGKVVADLSYARSSGAKWAWKDRNHGLIGDYDRAIKGKTKEASESLNRREGRTFLHGAAPSNDAEASELRASVDRVGLAGEAYQAALSASPAVRKAMPAPAIRKLFAPEATVERWLPKDLERAPEISAILAAMGDGGSVEYYGRNSGTRTELAAKLDALTADELNSLPKGGDLADRLSATLEARRAYGALHKLLCEELGQTADGRIDHRGAEKKLSSSMSPDNWLGLIFKAGSFAGALNILLAWAHKGTPIDGEMIDWLAYSGDVVQAGPVIVIQKLYLETLQAKREFLAEHPAPRSAEEEEQFQKLEAKRKLLNTLADYTSIFSGLRSVFVGAAYINQGEYALGVASLVQALSSFGWVTVQQTPNLDRAGTYLMEALKHLNRGDIALAVPALRETRRSLAGAAGQQTPVWLTIGPKTKATIRWSSIACGLIVPALVLIEEILSETSEKGPSVSQRTYTAVADFIRETGYQAGKSSPHVVVAREDGFDFSTQPLPEMRMTASEPVSSAGGIDRLEGGETSPWMSVAGFDGHAPEHDDWSSNPVPVTAGPGEDEDGRVNPELDQLGYSWVEVKVGDSIRLIASSRSTDVEETVLLNMDHIADPNLIYPGDRIYLPTLEV